MIIDLGCGRNKYAGAIGVDNAQVDGVDVVHDLLDLPYPFESECADEIVVSHVLEHFSLVDIVAILNECGRILKKGGCLIISVPHSMSPGYYQDPGHKTFFSFGTLYHFCEGHITAYRKDFQLSTPYRLDKLWARVNAFNDHFIPYKFPQKVISAAAKILFNALIKLDRSLTLSEVAAKVLPLWLVNVHAKLCKKE